MVPPQFVQEITIDWRAVPGCSIFAQLPQNGHGLITVSVSIKSLVQFFVMRIGGALSQKVVYLTAERA